MFNSTVNHWKPSTDTIRSWAHSLARKVGLFSFVLVMAGLFLVLGNDDVVSQDSIPRYLDRPSVFQELNKLRSEAESYQAAAVPNLQELIEKELAEAKKNIVENTQEVEAIQELHAKSLQKPDHRKMDQPATAEQTDFTGGKATDSAREMELKAIQEKLTASDRAAEPTAEAVKTGASNPRSSRGDSRSPTDATFVEVASYVPGEQGALSRNQTTSLHLTNTSDSLGKKTTDKPVVDWSDQSHDTGSVVPAAFDSKVLQLPKDIGSSAPLANASLGDRTDGPATPLQVANQELGGNPGVASPGQVSKLETSAIAAAEKNIDQTVQQVVYSTLVILLFGVAVMFVLYKLGIRGSKKAGSLKSFKVLEKTNINSTCQLQLVEIENHQVLVGVDKSGIKSVVCLPRNFGDELTDAELENENEIGALSSIENPAAGTWSPAARTSLGIDRESTSPLLRPRTTAHATDGQPRFGEPGSVEKRTA